MSKRFSRLNAALRYLQKTAGGEAEDAPAGTFLAKYQDYKAGKVKIEYTRSDSSKPGSLEIKELEPFGVDPTTFVPARVPISNRSLTTIGQYGVSLTDLGVSNVSDTGLEYKGFIPAKAIIRKVGTAKDTPTNSKITGFPYKGRTDSNSATYPFGQIESKKLYGEQKAAIIAKVEAGNSLAVSFKPEFF